MGMKNTMRLIGRYLTNNDRFAKTDVLYRKVSLLNMLLIGIMVTCSAFVVIDIVLFQMYDAALVNAAGVVIALIALIYFRKTGRYKPVAYIAIATLILSLLVFFAITQNRHYNLIWMSMVPLFAYFLLKRNEARIVMLLFGGYMLYFVLSNMSRWTPAAFNAQAVFNILGAMSAQLFMVSYYEKTREEVWSELNGVILLLDESRNDLRLILDSSAEAIYGIDKEGNCTFCNKSCLEMLAYGHEEDLLGQNMHLRIHHTRKDGTAYPAQDCSIYRAFTRGERAHAEDEVFWRADGTSFAVEYFSYPKIKNGEIVGAVITFMDITQRKQREAEIRYLNCYDMLTGLQNRRCFEESRVKSDTPENLPLSLVVTDINWLKMTNDVFGHAVGDELIQKAGQILKKAGRPGDTIARVGGDEFVMLLPRTSREETEQILSQIKTQFANTRVAAIKCSVSVGSATKQSPGQSFDEIMLDAENAMYRDKTVNRKSENKQMLGAIVEALHTKHPNEKRHSTNTAEHCAAMGAAIQLSNAKMERLKQAAYLHDIGKLVLDESIMLKDGYSREEAAKIQQHPLYGYRILSLFDETLDIAEYVYSHHEKWDGSGHPKGLQGEQIPLMSRIIAIAEAYDRALHSEIRPVEDRAQAAVQFIKDGAGTRFDPQIAEIFVQTLERKAD